MIDSYYDLIHAWYTPYMPVIVILLGEVCQRYRKTYRSHTDHSDLLSRIGCVRLHGFIKRVALLSYLNSVRVI